jgi:FSR family fosmidomycin resistance protein-like MFS transporter
MQGLSPKAQPEFLLVPGGPNQPESSRQTADGRRSSAGSSAEKTVYPILFAISFSHLLNDTMQSVIPSIYPIVKESFALTFTQVGLITFVFQLSAALLQPFVGLFTDKRPQPYSLAIGMGFTLLGLLLLSRAPSFELLLLAVGLVGIGSSVFHPEASRIAYLASGGRRGLAQSLFQVGGNAGSSLGPLLAALIIVPFGVASVGWFSGIALLAMAVLWMVGRWYSAHIVHLKAKPAGHATSPGHQLSRGKVVGSISILLVLIFSKYFYFVSLTSYLTFYMMNKFGVSVQASQGYLFAFLFAVAVGTFVGGPLGDRYGRKYVIWASILGVAPFTLALPYANLTWTTVLIVIIGLVMASAFSAILVYAQELVPGKVGLVSGLFFGFAFGMAGLGSAVLGKLADHTSIDVVYQICSFLPLIGLVTGLLPNIQSNRRR